MARPRQVVRGVRDAVYQLLADCKAHDASDVAEVAGPDWQDGVRGLLEFGYPVARIGNSLRLLRRKPDSRPPTREDIGILLANLLVVVRPPKLDPDPEPGSEEVVDESEEAGDGSDGDGDDVAEEVVRNAKEGVLDAEEEVLRASSEPAQPVLKGSLQIGDGLWLPKETVTHTFGVLGKKGSGKTTTALVMAEEMARRGYPFVVIDPLGAWWGLSCRADGTPSDWPVLLLGGDHGAGVKLVPKHGEVIADLVVERSRPIIVCDLSSMAIDAQKAFVTIFTSRLYEKNREAVHVFIDEADEFAPQSAKTRLVEKSLEAVDRLVRRGRIRGIGCTLISQRSAVLNKNVLSQVDALVVLRSGAPADISAIEGWIEYHLDSQRKGRVLSTLPGLPIGTAWWVSPAWLGFTKAVRARQRWTFDSSATPEVGVEPPKISPNAASVDEIVERLEAVDDGSPESDPGEVEVLRKEVEMLRGELSAFRRAMKRRKEEAGDDDGSEGDESVEPLEASDVEGVSDEIPFENRSPAERLGVLEPSESSRVPELEPSSLPEGGTADEGGQGDA